MYVYKYLYTYIVYHLYIQSIGMTSTKVFFLFQTQEPLSPDLNLWQVFMHLQHRFLFFMSNMLILDEKKLTTLYFCKLLQDTQQHRLANMCQSKSCMPQRSLGHRIFSRCFCHGVLISFSVKSHFVGWTIIPALYDLGFTTVLEAHMLGGLPRMVQPSPSFKVWI